MSDVKQFTILITLRQQFITVYLRHVELYNSQQDIKFATILNMYIILIGDERFTDYLLPISLQSPLKCLLAIVNKLKKERKK